MKVIVIANEKGGVAKTTTTVNLASELASRGKKVLVLDLDKQAHSTLILHRAMRPGERGIADVIEGAEAGQTVADFIVAGKAPNISVVPSGESTARAEIILAPMLGRESVLRRALDCDAARAFDYVLIDTSPSMGLLTINAFMAATHVLIPVSCDPLGAQGLASLTQSIERMRKGLRATFEVAGVLLTKYDQRKALTKEIEQFIRKNFGPLVFESSIGTNVRIEEAPGHQKTIRDYEGPKGKGTRAYGAAADELLKRIDSDAKPHAVAAAS